MRWSRTPNRIQFSSAAQSCPALCNPMDCSVSGFPVHHQLPELSCSLSWWCHPTISFSIVPFSSRLQSFQVSGSFQMSQLLASGGQSIRVWTSTSALPIDTQDWSLLGWTGWISLPSKGLSGLFSNTTVQKFSRGSALFYILNNKDPISLWEPLLFFIF